LPPAPAALAGCFRQQLVRACLTHDDGSASVLPLRLAAASADEARLLRLLREHLGRLQLAAPVAALRLVADDTCARPGASIALFEQPLAGEGAVACLERLRARLGEDSVRTLAWQPDHRPECATRLAEPAADSAAFSPSTATDAGSRPLWLLDTPQPLAEQAGGPHWHGPLQLLTRGERLESGWWDGGSRCCRHGAFFAARNCGAVGVDLPRRAGLVPARPVRLSGRR
jgi:protein ImuB